jgi:hypothetical protein
LDGARLGQTAIAAPADTGTATRKENPVRVSQDYAGKFMSATWFARTLKEHRLKELTLTIKGVRLHEFKTGEKPKYVLSFEGKEMEAPISKTNAYALANDLGDDSDTWVGNKVALSTRWGRTPNGMGDILHMRGVFIPRSAISHAGEVTEPLKANGADNAYAAASQAAPKGPANKDGDAGADLNDEIPF